MADPVVEKRFWNSVDRNGPDECWIWRGTAQRRGYGRFWDGERGRQAHRFAYELLVGPIPDGLVIDHLCRNPPCVNPAHLEPVTNQENIRRGEAGCNNRKKTHCPNGHPYTPDNVYIRPEGGRECRKCALDKNRVRKARIRQQERVLPQAFDRIEEICGSATDPGEAIRRIRAEVTGAKAALDTPKSHPEGQVER